MIISHKYKYIYLEPVGTDSHLGHQLLRDHGLIAEDDIASGVYIGEIELYSPHNFEPMTLDIYQEKFGFHNYARKPIDLIMNYVNTALTLDELVELGLVDQKIITEYQIFSPIREPIERFKSIMKLSKWSRPILDSGLFFIFMETLRADRYTHLLWQRQASYHKYKGEVVSSPPVF